MAFTQGNPVAPGWTILFCMKLAHLVVISYKRRSAVVMLNQAWPRLLVFVVDSRSSYEQVLALVATAPKDKNA